jgi:SpoIIAA-like
MIEQLTDAPPGALGFRVSGHLRRTDYTEVLLPPLRAAVERGDTIHVLVVLDPSVDGLEPGALAEDLKAALDLGLRHRSAWGRFAVVSDADWVRRAVGLFGWLAPGELRVFGTAETDGAKAWLVPG